MDNREPLVTIHCMTYNQENYIAQCLDGFVMQQTNFRFIAIVHDDASTDGTAAIVRQYAEKYPDIIKPIFQMVNQYSKLDGTIRRIMKERTESKYIAMCEGDDYWIDSLKLQRQVDFLEAHEEYGMCYTNFNMYIQETGEMVGDFLGTHSKRFKKEYKDVGEFIYERGFVCPPSWVFRKRAYDDCAITIRSLDTTFLLFAHFLYSTKVYYMPDITTVYRMHGASVTHSKSYAMHYDRNKNMFEMQLYLIEKYHLSKDLADKCLQKYLTLNMHHFILHKQFEDIAQARKLTHKTPYIRLCLAFGENRGTNLVINMLYRMYKKFFQK